MRPLIKAAAIVSVTALGIGGLASCSSAARASGHVRRRPVYGGTLQVISNAGPGSLDPVPTYNYAGYELERGYARQLVTYPTTRRVVLGRDATRSALTPVVSQFGIDVGTLLGGVVVVETVFGIGGIGQDSVEAIDQGNLPLIIGFVLAAAVFVIVANILVDIAYTLLDPRVRLS